MTEVQTKKVARAGGKLSPTEVVTFRNYPRKYFEMVAESATTSKVRVVILRLFHLSRVTYSMISRPVPIAGTTALEIQVLFKNLEGNGWTKLLPVRADYSDPYVCRIDFDSHESDLRPVEMGFGETTGIFEITFTCYGSDTRVRTSLCAVPFFRWCMRPVEENSDLSFPLVTAFEDQVMCGQFFRQCRMVDGLRCWTNQHIKACKTAFSVDVQNNVVFITFGPIHKEEALVETSEFVKSNAGRLEVSIVSKVLAQPAGGEPLHVKLASSKMAPLVVGHAKESNGFIKEKLNLALKMRSFRFGFCHSRQCAFVAVNGISLGGGRYRTHDGYEFVLGEIRCTTPQTLVSDPDVTYSAPAEMECFGGRPLVEYWDDYPELAPPSLD
jgi:hypothetical protein